MDGDFAAVWHSVSGIDDEVEDDLIEEGWVSAHFG